MYKDFNADLASFFYGIWSCLIQLILPNVFHSGNAVTQKDISRQNIDSMNKLL